MTPIACKRLLIVFLFMIPASAVAMDLTGTVVSVNGLDVTIKILSVGPFSPAVGDKVDVIKVEDGGRVEFDIGDWEVTEVDGKMVKAAAVNALGVNPPKVNMKAVIHLSPGPVHAGEPPATATEEKRQSVAAGKVIMTRGKDITIRLDKGQPQAAVGDVVELSFTAAGIKIPVGTWRVSALKGDGIIEARPLAPEGEPNIDMDARVFTDASKKKARVDSEEKPVQPFPTRIEGGDKSPLETACLNGNADSCYELGVNYENGNGVSKDQAQAAVYYKKSCEGGNARGCTNLGYLYQFGYGVKRDNRLAADYYRKGCDDGNALGCTNLGFMYEKGHGVSQDEKLAADYYRKGCDDGDPLGCTNLGHMYQFGHGVNQDYGLAADYYRKSCEGGNARGCTNLGYLYQFGYGVNKDYRSAADYYRKGCDGGNALGCTNLGYMYEKGHGVSEDEKQAAEYYRKGCDGGSDLGCGNLGWMVYQGRGTTPDRARGKRLLEQACGKGFTWSCDRLKEIGR